MTTRQKTRDLLFAKYDGRCAYCGDPLEKGWHVDEIEPVRRNFKYNKTAGRYVYDGTALHPERFHIYNQNPSCPSCNINKHSMSIEEFRRSISGYMKHLNHQSTQYKIAKRYGLIKEVEIPVQFYFETISDSKTENHQ